VVCLQQSCTLCLAASGGSRTCRVGGTAGHSAAEHAKHAARTLACDPTGLGPAGRGRAAGNNRTPIVGTYARTALRAGRSAQHSGLPPAPGAAGPVCANNRRSVHPACLGHTAYNGAHGVQHAARADDGHAVRSRTLAVRMLALPARVLCQASLSPSARHDVPIRVILSLLLLEVRIHKPRCRCRRSAIELKTSRPCRRYWVTPSMPAYPAWCQAAPKKWPCPGPIYAGTLPHPGPGVRVRGECH
jgi:hypothetical protein